MADPNTRVQLKADLGALNVYDRSVPIVASTTAAVGGMAITEWDLERFAKNPVILWAHDQSLIPIGLARDVAFDPAVGLTMRVHFASNCLADEIFAGVRDETVRAVSVGYDEVGNGRASLAEVSFVPVGMDEDAGTPALNPNAGGDGADEDEMTDELRAQVSSAAAHLARHRARLKRLAVAQRTDAGEGRVERMDRTPIRLDKAQDTPSGGKRIPARLSRTGILEYSNGDGTTRRELRLASEIFRADSLASLEHAPVIDIAHHTSMIGPDTWKKAALGHVAGVRADGRFIAADLHVNDRATLDAIAAGERTEISCGYRCRLDMTPGEHDGEPYDCVQREIVYNHAALCPPNRGRAGPEVGLRLDGVATNPWAIAHFDDEEEITSMATINESTPKTITMVRLDGKDYEQGTRDHLDAVERAHTASLEKVRLDAKAAQDAAVAEVQKRLDSVTGERDAFKGELEVEREDAKKMKAKSDDDAKAAKDDENKRVLKKVRLLRQVASLFGFGGDKETSEKMDALDEREIMIAAIQKRDAKFDAVDRSDDYVLARYDALVEAVEVGRRIDGVVDVARVETGRLDAGDGSANENVKAMVEARKARDAAQRSASSPYMTPTK